MSITGISGTLNNGNLITILGSGFGTKSSSGPLISSYDHATSANNWSGGSLGGSWTSSGTIGLNATSPLRSSLYQSSYKIRYNTNGGYATVRFNHPVVEDRLYLSFWLYRDYSTWSISTGSGSNNKFCRIYENGSGTGGDLFFNIVADASGNADAISCSGESDVGTPVIAATAMSAYKYVNPFLSSFVHAANANLQMGVWEHYEYDLNYPTNLGGSDGTCIHWKDGKLHSRTITCPFNYSTGSPDRRWVLIGLVSGTRTTSGYEYVDEVYIDKTPARVFISSASNLAASWPDNPAWQHSEIQVCSYWSANQIQFTLNRGTFGASDSVYVYVVDSSGTISNGYQVTLGGGQQIVDLPQPIPDSGALNWIDFKQAIMGPAALTKYVPDSGSLNWADYKQYTLAGRAFGPPSAPANLRIVN